MTYEEAFWFLTAKTNDLNWRHHQKGDTAQLGIEQFLAKKYRPGVESFTEHPQKD